MNTKHALLAFFVSGAIGFVLAATSRVEAAYIGIAGNGCGTASYAHGAYRTLTWSCSVPTGTSLQPSNISGAYFDHLVGPTGCTNFGPAFYLEKYTLNGSYYMDYTTGSPAAGARSVYRSASQIKASSSVWDYVSASAEFYACPQSVLHGVSVVTL